MTDRFMEHQISASAPAYAATLATLTEPQLTAELPDQPREGEPWFGYVRDARDASLFLNLQLNQLSSELRALHQLSRSAEISSQHQRAYRDLTGALAGVDETAFDVAPDADEWPLRRIIWHVTGAELGFSLLINWAVKRQAAGDDRPITMPREEMEPHYEAYPESGSMQEVMARYEELHRNVVGDLLPLDVEQLEALNIWWEGYELPAWFRMHRFDAHLREHTIQVDKTLAAIDRAPTEGGRLARLLHQSLADLEILLVTAGEDGLARAARLAAVFDERREGLLDW